ncbi:MAG: MBL fold metallo-hydrolase [Myxococcales bacterium]|nr:MBL fold metallo-hydrolase [Myxococcales bacterium]MCB9749154.1 MBL fold metallo-hydrolase [Myxococcales bacterium]
MQLKFVGGASTVTGSKHLVTQGETRVLVDCGLFQGVKTLRLRNWRALPFNPASLDAVVLTHAHIDHSGFLPVLVREGFHGPIYTTAASKELCEILLLDSGRLQEEEAEYANRKRFSRHSPALPLYTEADARRVLRRIHPVEYDAPRSVGALEFTLTPAGHILGAAGVALRGGGTSVHVSGDIGRDNDLLMVPPRPPAGVDWVVMESTYGDRRHPEDDPIEALGAVVRRTFERGGVLLIPAFAVGRTQLLLYCLHEVFARGLAPAVKVYVNSPMATDVTRLYQRYHEYHRLDEEQTRGVCRDVVFVRTVQESKRLNQRRGPAVIVSASGMLTGGRVLHHLRAFAPDRRNTILLTGYQVPGTRGGALVGGARSLKMHGDHVPVRAEVVQLDVFSAHADQEGLLAWLGASAPRPRGVFLVHGEPLAADHLRLQIEERLGIDARVPEHLETVEL